MIAKVRSAGRVNPAFSALAPFGADAASEASTVYREQVAELRYLSQALDHAPDDSTSVRPTPAVPSRLVRTLGASFSPLGGWSGSAIIVKPC